MNLGNQNFFTVTWYLLVSYESHIHTIVLYNYRKYVKCIQKEASFDVVYGLCSIFMSVYFYVAKKQLY